MLMSPQDLNVGGAYFQISFSDREFTIPGVDPMIYIGADVIEPDPSSDLSDAPRFVFQDPVSFSRFGSAVDFSGAAPIWRPKMLAFIRSRLAISNTFTISAVSLTS
jgi:hypothetical protein